MLIRLANWMSRCRPGLLGASAGDLWLGTSAGVLRISPRLLKQPGDPRVTVYHLGSAGLAEHAISDALTPAELDVLRLIASGHGNKQIAAMLSITEDSVKNILSKLGAADRTHAAMIAVKRGFI